MAQAYDAAPGHNHAYWKIADRHLPEVSKFDEYKKWPDGNCRYVYRADCLEAQYHKSGWAMKYKDHSGRHILRKKCLGVLVCSLQCVSNTGHPLYLRPATTNDVRQRQQGKPCPNSRCLGSLHVQPCRGRGNGYPVEHIWRHTGSGGVLPGRRLP
ncbi:hypothetical protein HPB48_004097 [Haemaphysalis longicornis]|uniref:GCM domain-containing protein n=1 Tax=Haemaphysalis longicornis TaxID=44386 RepID=A0A9J6FN80_HAELO|nr:hypothetical protein HPB48_004097 [Haemaphysalis longicornis]